MRCECKELIDKGICDKGFTWNLSNCEFECDKSCYIGEYLDYENCKCKKKLFDKLIECNSVECNSIERSSSEECTENIDKIKIAEMALFEHGNECVCFYTICVVLAVITFPISIGIATYFAYSRWYFKKRYYSC